MGNLLSPQPASAKQVVQPTKIVPTANTAADEHQGLPSHKIVFIRSAAELRFWKSQQIMPVKIIYNSRNQLAVAKHLPGNEILLFVDTTQVPLYTPLFLDSSGEVQSSTPSGGNDDDSFTSLRMRADAKETTESTPSTSSAASILTATTVYNANMPSKEGAPPMNPIHHG